jgi:hypothetical protein
MSATSSAPPTGKPLGSDLSELLDLARTATVAYERPDLTRMVDRAAARHEQRDLSILVVGEFKQGKSTLVNSLLSAPVCAIDDDVATVVPTVVRYGAEPTAHVVYQPTSDSASERREPVTIDQAVRLGSEAGNPGNRAGVRSVEISIPRRLLESGLRIVDTPGVGGLDSAHGAATMSALSLAEVVLFVSDTAQPLTAPEMQFLRTASERCPNVVLVQTKTDIHPAWRDVLAANRAYLDDAGLTVRLLPVSSVLRQRATSENSADLNEESGYAELVRLLRDSAEGDAARLAARTTLTDLMSIVDQLAAGFESERSILEDPESIARLVAELERARDRADRLRSQSAKWFQTLNDGAQDLTADLDHDLRLRVRGIIDASDQSLGESDPAKIWDEFEHWLHTRAAYDVSAHHHELAQRSDELARRVAEHFAEDESELGAQVDVPTLSIQGRYLREDVDLTRPRTVDNALAAMRGSYGGLLMFGMMGQMLGLALLNPLTIVVGLGLGRRALKEEKARKLSQRQQQAKNAVRKYIDDVNIEASKVSRDAVRQVHRDLRDEFSARADALQTTIRESLATAERTAKQAAAENAARLADVQAELGRLTALRDRIGSDLDRVGDIA